MKNVTNGINNIGKEQDKRVVDVRMAYRELETIRDLARDWLEAGSDDSIVAKIYRDSVDILAKI